MTHCGNNKNSHTTVLPSIIIIVRFQPPRQQASSLNTVIEELISSSKLMNARQHNTAQYDDAQQIRTVHIASLTPVTNGRLW